MDINSRLTMSYYKDIAEINPEHNITLVQHVETKKVYVKKILKQYNKRIYIDLMLNPIAGLPQVYEVVESNDELTVIEEYISGDTLQEMLDANITISPYNICKYVIQLCEILSILHSQNPPIIHRDIKPSNIMITPGKQVILIDLNAAKYVDTTKSADTTLLGTKGYAAPEQYGFGSSSEKTDIYAIGMLLKSLISETAVESHLISDYLNPIIEKCTYIDPLQRYSTVEEVKDALYELPLLQMPTKPKRQKRDNRFKKYLPPGFRTGNIVHILLATAGYTLLVWLSSTLEVKDATPRFLLLERIFCFLIFLSIILISGNYMDIHRKLPLCRHSNIIVRLIGIILFNFIAIFVILLIMSIIGTIIL